MIIKKELLIYLIVPTFFSCHNKNNFKREIVSEFEKGTDSTKEWLYINNNTFINSQKPIEGKIFQMITRTGGATYILTSFKYNKESNYDDIESIENKFIIDGVGDEYGHSFDFSINEYYWMTGYKNHASYMCVFDSLGNIIVEEGSILVEGYRYAKNKTKDFFFTTVFHTIDSVVIQNSLNDNRTLLSTPHLWFPLMDFVTLDFSMDSMLFIKTYSTRKNDKVKQVYIDTVYYKKHISNILP